MRTPALITLVLVAAGALFAGSAGRDHGLLAYTVPSDQQSSDLTLRRSGSSLELRDARGAVLARTPLAATKRVSVVGAKAGRDTLTLDLRGGPFAPAGGISYDGGAGGFDTLNVTGRPPADLQYAATARGAGRISSGPLHVAFSNLEPVNITGPSPTGLGVTVFDPDVTTVTIADDGTQNNGWSSIVGDNGFETVNFIGYAHVTVFGGDGPDAVTVDNPDVSDPDGAVGPYEALSTLTVSGDNDSANDPSSDTLNLRAVPAGLAVSLSGGLGNDTFKLGTASGSLAGLLGTVSIDGGDQDAALTSGDITCATGSFHQSVTAGDTLVVNGSGESTPATWTVTPAGASGPGLGSVSVTGVESTEVRAGTGADHVNVNGSAASGAVLVLGGGGDDVFHVTGTGNTGVVQLDGGGGSNQFTVDSTGTGSALLATGGSLVDTFNVNGNGGSSGVALIGSAGNDSINVHATSAGSLTNYNGGSGSNSIVVDPGQQGMVCGPPPTAAGLASAHATLSGRTAVLRWRTATQVGVLGYDVYRALGSHGSRVRVGNGLVTAGPTAAGSTFSFRDRLPAGAKTARYWLREARTDGSHRLYGPFTTGH